MQIGNIQDIQGMEFPAGRKTRVMIGPNGVFRGDGFSQGYVVIYKDGSIPEHDHETVETYTILRGVGEIMIDSEKQTVKPGDFVYIPSNLKHGLYNTGEEELHLIFVYAPDVIVDHWAQEQSGDL